MMLVWLYAICLVSVFFAMSYLKHHQEKIKLLLIRYYMCRQRAAYVKEHHATIMNDLRDHNFTIVVEPERDGKEEELREDYQRNNKVFLWALERSNEKYYLHTHLITFDLTLTRELIHAFSWQRIRLLCYLSTEEEEIEIKPFYHHVKEYNKKHAPLIKRKLIVRLMNFLSQVLEPELLVATH
jgi:hypothetical protein